MIVPDVNLLLYAYDLGSPFNAQATRWWQECLSGAEPVGLSAPVAFGFVRIGTSARVFREPMSTSEAVGHVRSWLGQPPVQVLDPGPRHVEQVLRLLEGVGAGGNLVTDAQLAALAIDYGAVLYTSDADFIRFPGLRWFNPITGSGNRSVRRQRPS